MTKRFALNHDKSLQIYFICVKHQEEKLKAQWFKFYVNGLWLNVSQYLE